MFFGSCRFCSENPLTALMNWTQPAPQPRQTTNASLSRNNHNNNNSNNNNSGKGAKRASKRNVDKFRGRTIDEIRLVAASWEQYVHPRAREFFPSQTLLMNVLSQIARGVSGGEDPILGNDNCVYWYGDVTRDDPQAAIKMVKPGETVESITYVNRVLVFIFATDDSFEQLMQLPKAPFQMSCGDQLCVNLNHISLSCASAAAPVSPKVGPKTPTTTSTTSSAVPAAEGDDDENSS